MLRRLPPALLLATLVLAPAPSSAAPPGYPWLGDRAPRETLAERIAPPAGYRRVAVAPGSFAAWLRGLPLEPAGTRAMVYDDGTGEPDHPKAADGVYVAVADLDTMRYQQCADAAMRLRAEYLWAAARTRDIAFRLACGAMVPWPKWAQGYRRKRGKCELARTAGADRSRKAFLGYLRFTFAYANTGALRRQLAPRELAALQGGDLLIQPPPGRGALGHAIVVLDVAEDEAGRRVMLLGQSYTPSQDFHVLDAPGQGGLRPWYRVEDLRAGLRTAEWPTPFRVEDLRRF